MGSPNVEVLENGVALVIRAHKHDLVGRLAWVVLLGFFAVLTSALCLALLFGKNGSVVGALVAAAVTVVLVLSAIAVVTTRSDIRAAGERLRWTTGHALWKRSFDVGVEEIDELAWVVVRGKPRTERGFLVMRDGQRLPFVSFAGSRDAAQTLVSLIAARNARMKLSLPAAWP